MLAHHKYELMCKTCMNSSGLKSTDTSHTIYGEWYDWATKYRSGTEEERMILKGCMICGMKTRNKRVHCYENLAVKA